MGDLARVPLFWGRMFCRSEPVLQTSCCECDSHRLHKLSRSSAERERFPAKEEAASAILAGITILNGW